MNKQPPLKEKCKNCSPKPHKAILVNSDGRCVECYSQMGSPAKKECPKCKIGKNDSKGGGNENCFHCNRCPYIECHLVGEEVEGWEKKIRNWCKVNNVDITARELLKYFIKSLLARQKKELTGFYISTIGNTPVCKNCGKYKNQKEINEEIEYWMQQKIIGKLRKWTKGRNVTKDSLRNFLNKELEEKEE